MTPKQFNAALEAIGWTQSHLSRQLGCSLAIPHRWAHGTAKIPGSIAIWLTALAELHLNHPAPEWRTR